MKLTTTLSLLALAAAPIASFPWQPKKPYEPPYHSQPKHGSWHHNPHPTSHSSSHRGPVGGSSLPPYPIPSSSRGIFPTGTGFPTGGFPTGSFPTGTNPGGSIAPVSSVQSSTSPINTGTGPTTTGGTSGSGTATAPKGTGVPAGCLKKNNIPVGWLPEAPQDFETITSNLGKPGCFFGQYSQITSSSYDGSQLTEVSIDELQGAIFIASVMPSIPFTEVTSSVASQVADVLKKFTDQGVEVYLRFGHEMNWYASSESDVYHGIASEFVTAWKTVAAAVADNDKISMFWSPNQVSDAQSLVSDGWWPGPDTVDIVGIDIYPRSHQTFAEIYQDFHDTFAKAFNKPFVIGETGYSTSSDSDKTYWLEQLSSAEALSSCPNYAGFSWFEYNKEVVFYVATNGETIAKSVLG